MIKIKKNKQGSFTRWARRKGLAKKKLTDKAIEAGLKSKSPTIRKKANFARMARRGWKPLKK